MICPYSLLSNSRRGFASLRRFGADTAPNKRATHGYFTETGMPEPNKHATHGYFAETEMPEPNKLATHGYFTETEMPEPNKRATHGYFAKAAESVSFEKGC